MNVSIDINGMEEVNKAIQNLSEAEQFKNAMQKAVLLVEKTAKEKCPSGDSGTLRSSIYSKVDEENGEIIGICASALQYAPYVEYGTGLFAVNGNGRKEVPWCYQDAKGEWHATNGMKPQPFMNPALDENRSEIIEILNGGNK